MASSRMLALLGLLAAAGYQNRDRLGEMLGKVTGSGNTAGATGDPSAASTGLGGLLGGMLGGASGGGQVGGGLADLIEKFTGAGQGDAANSWVKTGPNQAVGSDDVGRALGDDTIAELSEKTGLSRDELLSRLSMVLPKAVDQMTPEGRIPTDDEFANWGRR